MEISKPEQADVIVPTSKLKIEQKLLEQNLIEVNFGPERSRQVKQRLGAIAFELECREMELWGENPVTLFHDKSLTV